ncbi:MAG TPA: hypothetical protein VIU86_10615, partial [Gaiellaceae bacterium]
MRGTISAAATAAAVAAMVAALVLLPGRLVRPESLPGALRAPRAEVGATAIAPAPPAAAEPRPHAFR